MTKRFFLSTVITLLISHFTFAQDLYVLHVSGDILNTTNNVNLKVGDMISQDASLSFGSNNAKAIVIGKSTGKMLLDGSKSKKTPTGEFMSLVSEVLFPIQSNKQMSTRSVLFETVADISDYFNGDAYVFITDSLILDINQEKYPLNEEKQMALRFTSGEEIFNRWIPNFGDNKLLLEKDSLFEGASLDEIETVDVYYVVKATRKIDHIGSFDPIFVNQEQLKEELISLKSFLTTNQTSKVEEIQAELYQYVLDIYGQTDFEMFNEWIKNEGII
ncbi:hypothetical protein [Flammeovirga sp. SJP92]|uniref:hypothetical protein n=1 Tax=Flammeovirga sp. SJP92 TaxID=1775430 RepID=UPI0012F84B6D|nr:hypothetical protein [Flammeovirga sp. SJP92]